MQSSPAPRYIDDADEAAYWQLVDATAAVLNEPYARDYRAVLAALAGGDLPNQLLSDDLEIVDELVLLGLVKSGLPTELGLDVLALVH